MSKESTLRVFILFLVLDPKKLDSNSTIDINIESVKQLTTYEFCVTVENEAGPARQCMKATTAAIKTTPPINSSNFSTPQILVITSLILLLGFYWSRGEACCSIT